MTEIQCSKCKTKSTIKDSKNPVFPCDSCRKYFCGKCSELNSSEIRCMVIIKKTLAFNCCQCRESQSGKIIENKITEEIEKMGELLKRRIHDIILMEMNKTRELMGKHIQNEMRILIEKYQNSLLQEITSTIKPVLSNMENQS